LVSCSQVSAIISSLCAADAAALARENAIYFRLMGAVWPMTSTLNYALAAVIALGLFALTLAVMVW